jgi:hypothetical protein
MLHNAQVSRVSNPLPLIMMILNKGSGEVLDQDTLLKRFRPG